MPEKVWRLDEVFGITRDLPPNYVERKGVDPVFVKSLTRDKHVVIYGSSKQGKSSLRKRCLNDDDYIVVSCLNTMSLSDLHGAVLKSAGYRIEQTQVKTIGGHFKYSVEFKGKGKIPLFAEASGGGNLEKEHDSSNQTTSKRLEIDLFDVNDIISAISEIDFKKFIVLEDFHYLPVDTQKNFSFALKSFHENSKICFIVIGVWRDKNRLIYYNGDLTDRVVSIDADSWSADELGEVIRIGEQLLFIEFDEKFKLDVISNCFDSVYLAQEACHMACLQAEISETKDYVQHAGKDIDVKALIKTIVDDQAGRYSAFMTNFSEGFSTQVAGLEMYKWVLYSVLISDYSDLAKGIRRGVVSALIKAKHPKGSLLNEGNVTIALQNTASLQILKSVRPIILDYDPTAKVLNVVDKSFMIWMAYQDTDELILELDLQINFSPDNDRSMEA